jgi:hypothetical protein
MKSCSSFSDLKQFGIQFLTGEADALSFRILCDLDEQGVKVFKECFGIPQQYDHTYKPPKEIIGLAKGWNQGVASVMLTGHDIIPLAVMGFYLQGHTVILTHDEHHQEYVYALEYGESVVLVEDGPVYSYVYIRETPGGPHETLWPKSYGKIFRIIKQQKSDGKVVQGTRNVHQFTGRVQ